jgi:hypothetical protein
LPTDKSQHNGPTIVRNSFEIEKNLESSPLKLFFAVDLHPKINKFAYELVNLRHVYNQFPSLSMLFYTKQNTLNFHMKQKLPAAININRNVNRSAHSF